MALYLHSMCAPYFVYVCLTSHSIAVKLCVPDREGTPRHLGRRVCLRGKMDPQWLNGVPPHCDVVPSTLKDRKTE